MATKQRRWPKNAENARVDTIAAAEEAIVLLAEARRELLRNAALVELRLADATWLLERICRLMAAAKHGTPGSMEQDQETDE